MTERHSFDTSFSIHSSLFSYKRYFVNNLDSYHGEYILKHLSKVLEKNLIAPSSVATSQTLVGEDVEIAPPLPQQPYEIIGTVKDPKLERKGMENVTRVVPKAECLPQMLTCGTVILDVGCDRDELKIALDYAKLLKELLENEAPPPPAAAGDDTDASVADDSKKRNLILISTIMTWASTKPLDPETPDLPFVETDFRKRKPHPNYKMHYDMENEVIGIARHYKSQIRAIVVAPGVTYGGKEDVFFYWFQKAWECERLLPLLGRGGNVIPVINVDDLAEIIYNLVEDFPKKLYMLAVEQNITKQREIVKPLGRLVGSGLFKCIPPEDAFLIPEIDQRIFDLMMLNLNMEPTFIVETMNLQWVSEAPFGENVLSLMKDFKKERGLKSFKVVVYGPPIVGKTTLAKLICEAYGLMYISPETVAQDLIEDLSWRVSHWDTGETAALDVFTGGEEEAAEPADDEDQAEDEAAQDSARLTLAMLNSGRPLSEDEIMGFLRQRLLSREALNRGWVLDGFPNTLAQCSLLFEKGEEPESEAEEEAREEPFEEDAELYSNVLKKMLPDIVVSLEATDDFICEKAMRQPEGDSRLDEETVLKRLTEFRSNDARDVSPLNFFDELDIHPLIVPVKEHSDYGMKTSYASVALRMGRPCRYGKLIEQIEAAEKKEKEELDIMRAKEEKIMKEMEQKMKEEREEKMEYWSELYALIREEEEASLAAAGEPMRNYLVHHIFPTLTPALLEVAKLRPEDPIDFLAEYLFKLNPSGKMLEPGYNLQGERLLGKIKILDEALATLDIKIDPLIPEEAKPEDEEAVKKKIKSMSGIGWWYTKATEKNENDVGGVALLAASLRHQTTEFFNNSTLHGVRYIAEKERPFCEKFMWFSFTAVGAVTTCIIIVSLWEKFQTNPTITGLDTDFHNWDVPFPAVTMCDVNPVDDELLQEYIESVWGSEPPDNAAEYLQWLATLSYSSIKERAAEYAADVSLVGPTESDATAPASDPKDAVFKIVRHCETIFYDCEWKGDSEECCDLLMPVFTEMGFCYAFNSRHAEKYWPWQSQAQSEQFLEAFIHETDAKWSFLFNSDRKNTTINIYIHSTEEMAGLEQSAQHSWDHRVDKVSFSVKHTYTTEDARQLSVRQRRCVFADEQKLETSSIYTYSACMRQCRMQRSRSYCKCVPHFYPPLNGYRVCTVRELACVAQHADAITDVSRCACELGCTHTVYEVEKLSDVDKNTGSEGSSSLETEFVSWPMVRYKREVLFGWVDLLVSFGGIAGLFLGFSLLSGVELVYYFTLRAWCAAARDGDMLRQERAERRARPKPPHDLSLIPWWKKPPIPRAPAPIVVRPKEDGPPQYSPPPGYTTYLP